MTNTNIEVKAMNAINNYDKAKANIKVNLIHKDKAKGAVISAKEYGYDDLVLQAGVELDNTEEGRQTMIVTEDILEKWGVSIEEVINKGIENTKYRITSMRDMLIGMMFPDGVSENDPIVDIMLPPEETAMYVVSTPDNLCGAVAIIKARAELEEKFPNGYVVLPSSIHEVIVIPWTDEMDEEELLGMVKEINGGVVEEADRLTDNVYKFVA